MDSGDCLLSTAAAAPDIVPNLFPRPLAGYRRHDDDERRDDGMGAQQPRPETMQISGDWLIRDKDFQSIYTGNILASGHIYCEIIRARRFMGLQSGRGLAAAAARSREIWPNQLNPPQRSRSDPLKKSSSICRYSSSSSSAFAEFLTHDERRDERWNTDGIGKSYP